MANDREAHRKPVSPVLRDERIRSYHLPFLPPSPDYLTAYSGHTRRSEDSFDTVSSVSFAEVSKPSTRTRSRSAEEDDVMTPLRPTPSSTTRSTRTIHNSDRISITQLAFAMQREVYTETTDYYSYPDTVSSLSGIRESPPVYISFGG
jgi:hypothetical protein